MKKTKVAIYSGAIPSTTFIENLVKAASSENIQVLIFGTQTKPVNYNNFNISIFRSPKKSWRTIPFVIFNIILLRFQHPNRYWLLKNHIHSKTSSRNSKLLYWSKYLPIIKNLPDIFHLQWVINCDEWIFLKEQFGVKLIFSLRGAQINYKPLAYKEIAEKYKSVFPLVDGFHAVSKDIAIEAIKYNAPADKIKVIYSGIDLHTLSKYKKQEIQIKNRQLNIISAGRVHWKKGYNFALDALKKFKDKGYSFHYTIVAGLNEEEILYHINDLNLNSNFTLHKSMPQEKMFELMKCADLFLLPSFEEGIANVVLEAMAIGLPVLSSDCGGMSEVIKDGQTGYLYKKREQNDLINKLELAFNDSIENRRKIVDNAIKFVEVNHPTEKLGIEMRQFYSETMNFKQ